MAKFTQFSFNQYGELVYRKTGRTAPASYSVRGSVVYGSNGRKIGQIGRGTSAQREIIQRRATAGGRTSSVVTGRYSFSNIKRARERAITRQPNLQLRQPMPDASAVRKFGKSVKAMSEFLTGQGADAELLRQKIRAMENEKLMTLYQENEMIFDVYFDYGGIKQTDRGMISNQQTAANARALVEVYERRFGPIAVQARL